MTVPGITLADVLAATRAVALRLRAGDDAEAAAQALCDRAAVARAHRLATASIHPRWGDGSLAGAAAADAAHAGRGAAPDCDTLLRAAAAVCRVLADRQAEPGPTTSF